MPAHLSLGMRCHVGCRDRGLQQRRFRPPALAHARRAALCRPCAAGRREARLLSDRARVPGRCRTARTQARLCGAPRSVLNIAEGCGRRSPADKTRFCSMARGSATECAAIVDLLAARGLVDVRLRNRARSARPYRTDAHEARSAHGSDQRLAEGMLALSSIAAARARCVRCLYRAILFDQRTDSVTVTTQCPFCQWLAALAEVLFVLSFQLINDDAGRMERVRREWGRAPHPQPLPP